MRQPIQTITTALLAFALLFPAVSDAGMTLTGKPKATFFATGSPGFMSIEGVTNAVSLADDGAKLTFTVPMSTVDSGIALRDEHMNKNYVQIDKYPNVTLEFAKSDVTWPTEEGKSVDGSVKGTFNMHGVAQPATVEYTLTKTKTGYKVKGKFNYDVGAHGITIEPYMGISFDHKMYATVTLELADAP